MQLITFMFRHRHGMLPKRFDTYFKTKEQYISMKLALRLIISLPPAGLIPAYIQQWFLVQNSGIRYPKSLRLWTP